MSITFYDQLPKEIQPVMNLFFYDIKTTECIYISLNQNTIKIYFKKIDTYNNFIFHLDNYNIKVNKYTNKRIYNIKKMSGNSVGICYKSNVSLKKTLDNIFFDDKIKLIIDNLDFIDDIDASFKDELLTKTGNLKAKWQGIIELQKQPYLNIEYLGILVDEQNELVKNSPLKQKKIRQAINYGFDRKKMMLYLRNSIGIAAESGFVPCGLPSFDSVTIKVPSTVLSLYLVLFSCFFDKLVTNLAKSFSDNILFLPLIFTLTFFVSKWVRSLWCENLLILSRSNRNGSVKCSGGMRLQKCLS